MFTVLPQPVLIRDIGGTRCVCFPMFWGQDDRSVGGHKKKAGQFFFSVRNLGILFFSTASRNIFAFGQSNHRRIVLTGFVLVEKTHPNASFLWLTHICVYPVQATPNYRTCLGQCYRTQEEQHVTFELNGISPCTIFCRLTPAKTR